jgi:hypothetical protein
MEREKVGLGTEGRRAGFGNEKLHGWDKRLDDVNLNTNMNMKLEN